MSLLKGLTNFIMGDSTDAEKLDTSLREIITNIEANVLPMMKMHPTQKFESKIAKQFEKEILSQPNIKGNNAFKAITDVLHTIVLDKEDYISNMKSLMQINQFTRTLEFAEISTLVSALTATNNLITKLVSIDVIEMSGRPYARTEQVWVKELAEKDTAVMVGLTIGAFSYGAKKLNKMVEQMRYVKVTANTNIKELPTDGTRSNLLPVVGNLVVWIGKHFNSISADMYRRDKAYRDRLALEILSLEERKSDESDEAKLKSIQGQIDYYTNLINKIETKIELVEGGVNAS